MTPTEKLLKLAESLSDYHKCNHWSPISGNAGEVIRILVEGLLFYKNVDDKMLHFAAGFSITADMEDKKSIAYQTLQRAAEAGEVWTEK